MAVDFGVTQTMVWILALSFISGTTFERDLSSQDVHFHISPIYLAGFSGRNKQDKCISKRVPVVSRISVNAVMITIIKV